MGLEDDSLCDYSAAELAILISQRELSPVDLAEALIARIEALDHTLTAFCDFDAERARRLAHESERVLMRHGVLGPLHGIPVAVKDLLFTADMRTTGGSPAYESFIPDEDDIVVERIKSAGGIILGKTNVSEFGYGAIPANSVFGETRNPWDHNRTSGGSSGGSATAVAARMCPLAVGSDGGGSIRVPASFCGIYGLKPSFGRVPMYPGCRDGRYPGFSGWESIEHIGPMARSVQDAAILLDAMAGADRRDRHSIPAPHYRYSECIGDDEALSGRRIGWTFDWGGVAQVAPEVRTVVAGAIRELETLGADVEEASPRFESPSELMQAIIALDSDVTALRSLAQSYPLDPLISKLIIREWTGNEFSDAVAKRKVLYNEFWRFFETYDLLVTPTTPVVALPLGTRTLVEIGGRPVTEPRALSWFTSPLNLTGHPAASLPCGRTLDGLPVGLQIVGDHLDDRLVLQASDVLERHLKWKEDAVASVTPPSEREPHD